MKVCETCGKPITCGCITDGSGLWFLHEGKCFEKYMDKAYGKHKWMELGGGYEDGYEGYYIVSSDAVGGYEGTGYYYTEYDEEDM